MKYKMQNCKEKLLLFSCVLNKYRDTILTDLNKKIESIT